MLVRSPIHMPVRMSLCVFIRRFAVLYWHIARDHVGFATESLWVPEVAMEMEPMTIQYLHALLWVVMITAGVGVSGMSRAVEGAPQYMLSVLGIVLGINNTRTRMRMHTRARMHARATHLVGA